MLFLSLIFVSYLFFVFIAETFNPLDIKKSRLKKPRRKFAAAAALVSFFSGVFAIVLIGQGISLRAALVVYLILSVLLLIPFLIRFKRTRYILE